LLVFGKSALSVFFVFEVHETVICYGVSLAFCGFGSLFFRLFHYARSHVSVNVESSF
jgi:hypothetical protein